MLILHPSSRCDVCLEAFTLDTSARLPHAIPCGHIFCNTCLRAIRPSRCPLCRNPFFLGATKKLHVGHPAASSEQDSQEIELLRRLALSWWASTDEQVKLMEEIDVWLGGQQSVPLRKAREAMAKYQQLVTRKEEDKRTIRHLKREAREHQTRLWSDKNNAQAIEASLLDKSKKLEEKVAQCEAEMESLRTENTRVAQYQAEMESLRTENDRKVAQYEAEIERLKTEISRQVDRYTAEEDPNYKKLQVRTNRLDDENHRLLRELKASKSLLTGTQSLLEVTDGELEAIKSQLTNARTLLEVKDEELKALKSLLTDTQTLLEVRDEELKAALVFHPQTDSLSTADVVQQVTALNHEIFQMAVRLGGLLQNAENPGITQEPVTEALEDARWMLGKQMASVLRAKVSDGRTALNDSTVPDPLLAEVVFRIAITKWCNFMISSWKPSDHSAANFMSSLYSGIRRFEDSAVSARWRSITRAQLRRSSCDNLNWSEDFMQGLNGILNVAGWSIREPDRRLFEMRLPFLFVAVNNLRNILGEEVTSIDLELATVEAGTVFNPAHMKADWTSSSFEENAPGKVIGTTALGLWARKGHIPHLEMILLPRVVLEGVLRWS